MQAKKEVNGAVFKPDRGIGNIFYFDICQYPAINLRLDALGLTAH